MMTVDELLSDVVVLNQDERTDRLDRVTKVLGDANVRFRRFSAKPPASEVTQAQMDAWNANVPPDKGYLRVTQESAARIAAILSYAEIMDSALKSHSDHVVVFEDDVYVPPDFRVRLAAPLRELPSDWQFLAIGMALTDKPRPVSDHLWANPVGWGNFAYAARGPAIPFLRDLWSNPIRPGDHLWEPFLRSAPGVFAVRPLLAIHLLCDSNTKLVASEYYPMLTRAFSWLGSRDFSWAAKRKPNRVLVPLDNV
jgi:GR25 family glycosyltransferase involved in LPS biosynthesis